MQAFLFLHETSHIENIDGTDFKNDNSFFFKFQPKNTSEKSKVFSFYEKLCMNLILLN